MVEKIGDYIFKLEFNKEEEKERVLDGGPWQHKGDALIVVHYDRLVRPSDIKIQSLGLWVRFYDLSPSMMDCRYIAYMRIQVEYCNTPCYGIPNQLN
jgi:hypothetical protein